MKSASVTISTWAGAKCASTLSMSTSRSPGTPTATISPSTLTSRFFSVAEAGTPSWAASVSMVGVSGVGISSAAGTPAASTGFSS